MSRTPQDGNHAPTVGWAGARDSFYASGGYDRILDWPRIKRAMSRRENWGQLTSFCLIGGSGYGVNLALFSLCVVGLGADPHVGAVIAFVIAAANNYIWNRRWTFRRTGTNARSEVVKFLVVSTASFLASLAILTVLLAGGAPTIPSQIISIATVTPVSFVGNKLWTFR